MGVALMVFTSILFTWEVLQMIRYLSSRNLGSYLFNVENGIQLFLICSTTAIVTDSRDEFNSQEELRHLAALCIVLTWTLLLFVMGNRWFSTYVAMFRTVALTYMKLVFFAILVVAYGLAFYIMLHRSIKP